MTIKHLISGGVLALTIAASAGSAFLADAGTALAPEPAKLKSALSASAGQTAAAYYTTSGSSTSVRYYTGSWTSDSYGPAAGTPCSPYSLAADAVTSKVIQVAVNANGTPTAWRRCV